jgi:uncharacterized protein YsxB (DUF464 family)
MHFKRAMMYMRYGIHAHEETMMVDIVCAAINVSKESNILLLPVVFNIEEVARHEIEGCGVKGDHFLEVLNAKAKVTQLYLSVTV